jgi:serine/threonine protein kinase
MSKTTGGPHWERVKDIFQRVLDQPPPERAAVLRKLCGDDSGLRAEVEALLSAKEEAGSFCEHPAVDRPSIEPAEHATLAVGTRLSHYEIVDYLASGGMGEVYRAVDTRLRRTVAIKLLSLRHAQDREMRARFDREAYAVARLNHPHICTLLDVGHTEDRSFLVLEYIRGETLSQRLAHGALALPDLLRTAAEIISALNHAHRNGVIHRDLKPTNILLTAEGTKLCDFGLAVLKRAGLTTDDSSPPQTAVTTEREIIGTLRYMSPEQLEGQEADERSDIFSLGAVMYEMATGEKAFAASSEARLIAAVLTSQPSPVIQRRPLTPPLLDQVIQRCLAKDPAERWQSISDLEAVLKWIATSASPGEQHSSRREVRTAWYLAVGAAAALLLAVVSLFAARGNGRSSEPMPSIAVTVPPPEEGRFTLTESSAKTAQLAVSPDGRMLAFVASGADGISQIWIRRMDSTLARPLAGTADAAYPFWSPNSRSLGFFAGRKLCRIDLDGGPARTLADAPNGRGGTWNSCSVRTGRARTTCIWSPRVRRVARSCC